MNTKQKRITATLIAVIALLILLVVLLLLRPWETKSKGNTGQLIESVNQIVEMPDEDKQAAINELVAENEINISYETHPIFVGDTSKNFRVRNIPNNHYPIVFKLYDENGKLIYESDLIDPGYEVLGISLDRTLELGEHKMSINIGYYGEGNVQSTFPIIVTVNE